MDAALSIMSSQSGTTLLTLWCKSGLLISWGVFRRMDCASACSLPKTDEDGGRNGDGKVKSRISVGEFFEQVVDCAVKTRKDDVVVVFASELACRFASLADRRTGKPSRLTEITEVVLFFCLDFIRFWVKSFLKDYKKRNSFLKEYEKATNRVCNVNKSQ